ncbi:MAG: 6-phosphogluconolactonase [Solirubrobacterales bacterium]
MDVEEVVDADAAAARAAELIAEAGREAVAARGSFSVAVSGGRTPWRMLAILAGADMPWEQTTVFQVDERVAEPGSRDRNLTHLLLALPLERHSAIRPMPVTGTDLDAAAAQYASDLPERLDLVHLGLGPDGHTASLVPGDAALDVADRTVAMTASAYQGHRRMTLTYPALDLARRILWLVTGAEKRDALERLLAADPSIPAGRVRNDEMLLVADAGAAGRAVQTDVPPNRM